MADTRSMFETAAAWVREAGRTSQVRLKSDCRSTDRQVRIPFTTVKVGHFLLSVSSSLLELIKPSSWSG